MEGTKEFKVNKFIFHEKPNELILQNASGVVRIKENRLISLIKEWEKGLVTQVKANDIFKIFENDTFELINFLEEYGIIEDVEDHIINFNIQNIFLYSNDKAMNNLFNDFKNKGGNTTNVSLINEKEITETKFKENDLFVIFLNPYNKRYAKKIRDIFKLNTTGKLLMTYVYGDAFYMDTIYCGDWQNPCHICHIENIEAQLRIKTTGNYTYQNIIDSIYSEIESFDLYYPVNYNQMITIFSKIINWLSKFVELKHSEVVFPEEYQQSTMLDLKNMDTMKDYVFHWELCDCYE
ncbi:hypothetical protein GCM10007063_32490 [Lentibacillus kapialis]|uniref:McbB family protein n=1 Tax=Lentibacillus kapialis TaxID=340214 RepID=A0A917Q2C5_9BACI|nr:McbB family protein [Lentibacillus kapialis]GGK07476.1 hypothetical protein GCM10007063_32490 [Lentibacillus kapialis]